MDQFDLVRTYFEALNRGNADAAAALYDSACTTENVFGEHLVVRGREANRLRLQRMMEEFEGGHEGGDFYRVRTIGGIGTGWGWVQADWILQLRNKVTGEVSGSRGYSHFLVEDGVIRRQRSVVTSNAIDIQATPEEVRPVRHYPERPVVGVGAVVVVNPSEQTVIGWRGESLHPAGVVLIKRRYEPLAGQWSLPGGTLEVGETLEAGVAREIAEETGLAVEVGPVIEVFDRILFDEQRRVRYHFVLIDYLCRPRGGRLQFGSDVSDVILADPARLGEYHLTAKAEGVIQRALRVAHSET